MRDISEIPKEWVSDTSTDTKMEITCPLDTEIRRLTESPLTIHEDAPETSENGWVLNVGACYDVLSPVGRGKIYILNKCAGLWFEISAKNPEDAHYINDVQMAILGSPLSNVFRHWIDEILYRQEDA